MVKVKSLLKKAHGTYSQERKLYNTFLDNRHHLPLRTLLNNDIDNERLVHVLEHLNSLAHQPDFNQLKDIDLLSTIQTIDLSALDRIEQLLKKREEAVNHENHSEQLQEHQQISSSDIKDLDTKIVEQLQQLQEQNKLQNEVLQKLDKTGSQSQPQQVSQHQTELEADNHIPTSSHSKQQEHTSQPQSTSSQPAYNGPPINIVAPPGGQTPSGPINIVAGGVAEVKGDDRTSSEVGENSSLKLAEIPDTILKTTSTDWEPVNYKNVDVTYDLYELAKVEIKHDEEHDKILYKIIEPELTEQELKSLEELKRGFVYVFEKFSPEFMDKSGKDLIVEGTRKLASRYKIKLTAEQMKKISYYLVRDFLGLEEIEPIMHDPYIEDISCDGLNTAIFVNHLKYGPLEVNRSFRESEKLNSFIIKLAQRSNQEVSLSKPILQGALPDGSRIEAIYGKEISEKGSSFTIRKFREEPFTPIHLIDLGTMPAFVLSYLWLAVENKQSVMVSGGTATGKTTILNALSLFAPPNSKIVSIEDTPEINLPHEHWLSLVARESEGKAEVTMFDLLKASLRERPDYIIVGEIRGSEASILFQGMATGHAGLGTVHAEKFDDLVNRMTIPPISLPKQLLTELNIIIFMKQMKVKNNVVRRASSIVEVVNYNQKQDLYLTNEFVRYTPLKDEFTLKEKSAVISQLVSLRGGQENAIWQEIEKRRRILDFMHKNQILEFREVSNVLQAYHKDPSNIFHFMEEFVKERQLEKKNE